MKYFILKGMVPKEISLKFVVITIHMIQQYFCVNAGLS